MSRAGSTDNPGGVYVPKARADVYTVLLAMALAALLFGCLFLVLELSSYEFQLSPPGGGFASNLSSPHHAPADLHSFVTLIDGFEHGCSIDSSV